MTDHDLIRRRDAAQATLARFRGPTFAWGKWDCAKMLHFHLRQLGHVIALGEAANYRTLIGARRALRQLGYRTLVDALDARFARIAPASAIVGDALALAGDTDLGAITVALGNGRALGYFEGIETAEVIQPRTYVAAWRIDPA